MRIHLFTAAAAVSLLLLSVFRWDVASLPASHAQQEEKGNVGTAKSAETRGNATEGNAAPAQAASGQLDRAVQALESGKEDVLVQIARIEEEKSEIQREISALAEASDKVSRDAAARVTALYKFRQMRYFFFLSSVDGLNTAMEAGRRISRLLRDDHRVLLDFRERALKIKALEALLARKEQELGLLKPHTAVHDEENGAAGREMTKTSAGDSQQGVPYAKRNAEPEENRRNPERRALIRKPVPVFGETPFEVRRGSLPLPVRGEIVETYGMKPRNGSASILHCNGVLIAASAGEPVKSIHEGIVMFAGPLKEYGEVMIINHGDHYYSLIAHVDGLLKKAGDSVKMGETIAAVRNEGSVDGSRLYLEIRYHGKPVDPQEWLAVDNTSRE